MLFSSHWAVRLFGVTAFVSFVAAYAFYATWFISVWCFSPAVLSAIVLLQFPQRSTTRSEQPSLPIPARSKITSSLLDGLPHHRLWGGRWRCLWASRWRERLESSVKCTFPIPTGAAACLTFNPAAVYGRTFANFSGEPANLAAATATSIFRMDLQNAMVAFVATKFGSFCDCRAQHALDAWISWRRRTRIIHAQEESMSGKKKLLRRRVVLVSPRRGGGRRKVRTGIAHRASIQFAFGMIILAVFLTVLGSLFRNFLH